MFNFLTGNPVLHGLCSAFAAGLAVEGEPEREVLPPMLGNEDFAAV